jgi:four helix bundle protein
VRFEELDIWKHSVRLSSEIYRWLRDLRDYGFRDQLIRSGLSVPSNIAEGFERGSHREFLRFLAYAKGSCGQLRTQVYVGIDIGYIDRETGTRWIGETVEISSMLAGLIKRRTSFLGEHD